MYAASSSYTWGYDVNVVKVTLKPPAGMLPAQGNGAPGEIATANRTAVAGGPEYAVAANPAAFAQGVTWEGVLTEDAENTEIRVLRNSSGSAFL